MVERKNSPTHTFLSREYKAFANYFFDSSIAKALLFHAIELSLW